MIKINLLNSYADAAKAAGGIVSEDSENQKVIKDFAKRAVILIIGPLGLFIYEAQTIPVLQAKLAEASGKFNELKSFNDSKQGLLQEIKKYEIEQSRFNAQMDFINKIDHDKVNEYRLFDHLKTSTPDNVWIKKLDLMDNKLTISAESDDPKDIATFIQRLSNADFIGNLIPTNQKTLKNFAGTDVNTTEFTVNAQLNANVGKSP